MQRDYQRESQHLSFTETLLQDLRFMLRMLRKSPQFTVITLLVLALGIGANAAIFSLIEGVLLRPLDYRDPERLFTVREVVPKLSHLYPTLPANAKHVAEWQNRCSSFEDIAQMNTGTVSLSGSGEPQQIMGSNVSWNFFQVLGTQARLGRTFLPEEDQPGRNDVVVLSNSLWQKQFNANSSILNNKVLLDGKPYTVIGILPAEFRYPEVELTNRSGKTPEVFMTLGIDLNTVPNLGDFDYEVIARIQKNVSAEQALAELNSVQSQISAQIPGNVELLGKMQPLQDAIVGSSRQDLLVLFAAVGAILLIVCVNLANLLLARMKRRKREFAVRAALGASPGRLIRQCLTEGLTIALMGGALGIALASLGIKILTSSAPVDLPRLNDVRLNWAVILFAILISGFAGIVISILPAWKIARGQQNEDLKTGPNRTTQGPRSARMRQMLVVAEVSLSLTLVVAAGLLLTSFVRLLQVDKGFQTQNILTMNLILPSTKYTEDNSIDQFYTQMVSRVEAVPGVVSAGIVSLLPLQGESWIDAVTAEGDQRPVTERPQANYRFISPDYFKAIGIPLLDGRTFDERDRKVRAAIISQATAQALWPGQNPIGIRFKRAASSEPPFEVIGVIADIRTISLQQKPGLMVYVPYWERLRPWASLVVRTNSNPTAIASSLRSAIWQIDDQVPITRLQTMEQLVDGSVAQRRFQLGLVSLFAISALLLASLGIYGIVAESVGSRTNEIGIRMALGADGSRIRLMILREGLLPVALGIIIGVAASLAVGRLLSSLLFEVKASDPLILFGATLIMTLVAIAACYLPARKASRVDPLVALRYE